MAEEELAEYERWVEAAKDRARAPLPRINAYRTKDALHLSRPPPAAAEV